MPYDPRMLQMTRAGVGMMGNQPNPFDRTARPPQWWEQPMPQPPPQAGQSAKPDDTGQSANQPKQPPSLYDMMTGLGRMTRPQYDKAIQGQGAHGTAPKEAARLGPWAFLGSLGMPSSGGPR